MGRQYAKYTIATYENIPRVLQNPSAKLPYHIQVNTYQGHVTKYGLILNNKYGAANGRRVQSRAVKIPIKRAPPYDPNASISIIVFRKSSFL